MIANILPKARHILRPEFQAAADTRGWALWLAVVMHRQQEIILQDQSQRCIHRVPKCLLLATTKNKVSC